MNVIHVHYRTDNGEIVGYENTIDPQKQPGCEILSVVVDDGHHCTPDSKLHRVDLKTLEIADKTDAERAQAAAPTLQEVQRAIALSLASSDQFVMPDRPMTDTARAEWVTYRQALRELSKYPSPSEMIDHWPARPDGGDPIPHLRSRIPAEG